MFIRWCLIAFFEAPQDDRPTVIPGPENFAKESVYWELFVDVFYRLFQDKKEHNGLTALNKRRKDLGYRFILPRATRGVPRPPILPDQSIEAASEAFLATIPKDDGAMNINGLPQYRSLRRAAHPQNRPDCLSRKDRESRMEIKSSNTERKRNRRREHRNKGVRHPEKAGSENSTLDTGLDFPVKETLIDAEVGFASPA